MVQLTNKLYKQLTTSMSNLTRKWFDLTMVRDTSKKMRAPEIKSFEHTQTYGLNPLHRGDPSPWVVVLLF